MWWHAGPRFLLFQECPGINFALHCDASEPGREDVEGVSEEGEKEGKENEELGEVVIDYMEEERKRIVEEQKKKFDESRARAERIRKARKEREDARKKKESEVEEDELEIEMRLPEGSRCGKCKGRVQYGIKMKYGCRDRNRGHTLCSGECFLKEMKRTGKCKVCRKEIVDGTSDRKYCNGMCTVVFGRRKRHPNKGR